ncbi:flavin monoamine oxidase family protein [Saccharothrix sp. ALI-22-I]|uniref:flavin monoamine oxidase family protein n=1 Tax=Saccharothrix sp. ALI-22-I TaxID=1933778 RepID=UPI00097C3744|nr:FAD-dependent oxidoreductase [Saccharothrix sp. ALI-22-I]
MTESVDYAIVGGGVSGLYTAWRLLDDDPTRTVVVLEASDRIGGRLLTWNPAGENAGLRAELGGMRFFPQQEMVTAVINRIGLTAQRIPFYTTGPGLIWSLRGNRCAAGDIECASSRYALEDGERDKSPADLVNGVIEAVLKDNGVTEVPTTRKGWDELKPKLTYRGRPLWTVGYWNLLYDKLSPEAYRYIVDAFGYYTTSLNWNAAEAFQALSLDFTTDPAYETLAKGFDQIPRTLAEKVRGLDGDIRTDTPVRGFEAQSDGSVLLKCGPAGDVHARNVVLCLPRRSLELLDPSESFDLHTDERLRALVSSVRPYPAFKLFLLHEQRWWEQYGFNGVRIEHGRSVTDMPIRQTYYLRPDACEQGTCPEYGLVMASYDDSTAVDFWRGLEQPDSEVARNDAGMAAKMAQVFAGFTGLALDSAEAPPFDPPPVLHEAPEAMIDHARRQLARLHGIPVEQVPQPLFGAYADWSLDPFGGGWNFWEPQANPQEVMPAVRRPLPEANLYIAGEAYSGVQGWVEGALTTAEKVLQDGFKLEPPDWLNGVYLGW